MELVSRWGSPLTSEAPHSMAYPSPVKRRGHTTDLSDCQGPSARPTLSLSVWSWRGQASRSKATKHCSPLWMTKPTPHVSKTEQWRAPSQVSHQTCRVFFYRVWLPGRFCWFRKVHSVWEPLATESEAWHLNWQGNMPACCSVGRINHSELWADGADMILAGGQWPESEIPQVYHHFLSSSALQLYGCQSESVVETFKIQAMHLISLKNSNHNPDLWSVEVTSSSYRQDQMSEEARDFWFLNHVYASESHCT